MLLQPGKDSTGAPVESDYLLDAMAEAGEPRTLKKQMIGRFFSR